MELSYKDVVPHIDFNRDTGSIEYGDFKGLDSEEIKEFSADIEGNNDSIELHLVRTKAYKEELILGLNTTNDPQLWERFLREEQKTFGGSKIFYLNPSMSRILVLSLKNEMMNKLNMVVTRINKVNEKLSRYNALVKKENVKVYESKVKEKTAHSKKDEVVHFINQNLK